MINVDRRRFSSAYKAWHGEVRIILAIFIDYLPVIIAQDINAIGSVAYGTAGLELVDDFEYF